jgi:hypothetical protein
LSCPESHVPKAEASQENTLCAGERCLAEDAPTCCDARQLCDQHTCADTDVDALIATAGSVQCQGAACTASDDSICCSARASCDELPLCGDTTVKRAGESDILCGGVSCSLDTDEDTCCEPRALCSTAEAAGMFECHGPWVPGALCAGAACTANDNVHCCRALCEDMSSCNDGWISIAAVDSTYCEGSQCTWDVDGETCCLRKASCALFECPGGDITLPDELCNGALPSDCDRAHCCQAPQACDEGVVCQTGEVLIAGQYCKGLVCEDADRACCCEPRQLCSDADPLCHPEQYLYRDNADEILCATASCKIDECCLARETCETYPTSDGKYACGTGMSLLPGLQNRMCLGTSCDEDTSDRYICCGHNAQCAGYKGCDATTQVVDDSASCALGVERPQDRCDDTAENDEACCQDRGTCTQTDCEGTNKILAEPPYYCDAATWTEAHCCGAAAKCTDYGGCPDGTSVLADHASTDCDTSDTCEDSASNDATC